MPEDLAGMDCVVNLAGGWPMTDGQVWAWGSLEYVLWPIQDGPMPDADHVRMLAAHVADLVVAEKNVLVQCGAGINRSGLVVCRALMVLNGGNYLEALEELRRGRGPEALSNGAFRDWLKSEEALEKGGPEL